MYGEVNQDLAMFLQECIKKATAKYSKQPVYQYSTIKGLRFGRSSILYDVICRVAEKDFINYNLKM